MKNITEYNFRELVGQFVKMKFSDGRAFPDPDFEEYVAYGYVDLDAGMTFEVIGGYKDGKIYTNPTSSNKIRYSEDLELEPYDDPDKSSRMTCLYPSILSLMAEDCTNCSGSDHMQRIRA